MQSFKPARQLILGVRLPIAPCMNRPRSLDDFHRSLAATIAWCADTADSPLGLEYLRSPQLRPPIDIGEHTDSLDLVRNAVQHVIDHRFNHLAQDFRADIVSDLSGGRLL